eukprot:scaffold2631_cov373-Pavlova_lutheri.AAC.7
MSLAMQRALAQYVYTGRVKLVAIVLWVVDGPDDLQGVYYTFAKAPKNRAMYGGECTANLIVLHCPRYSTMSWRLIHTDTSASCSYDMLHS